jgi:hypothetical protein
MSKSIPTTGARSRRVLVEVATYMQAAVLSAAAALLVINALRFHAAVGAWEASPTLMAVLLVFVLLFAVARGFRESPTGVVQAALRFLSTLLFGGIIVVKGVDVARHFDAGAALLAAMVSALVVVIINLRLRGLWPERRAARIENVVTVAVVAGLPFLPWPVSSLWLLLHSSQRAEARLTEVEGELHAGRWERPVLRGDPVEGNAADAQAKAMEALSDLPEEVFEMKSSALVELAAKRDKELSAWRASTQYAWAWNVHSVSEELDGKEPDYRPRFRAAHVLAKAARQDEPAECLRKCADIVRLAQDGAAGGGLVPLAIGGNMTRRAARSAAICARKATMDDLRVAALEFRQLVANPVSPSQAYALNALVLATAAQRTATLADSSSNFFQRFLSSPERRNAAAAIDVFLDSLPAWHAIEPARYPEGLESVRAMRQAWRNSGNAIVKVSAGGDTLTDIMLNELSAQAMLRLTVIELEVLIARKQTGELRDAPPVLDEPALRDPFSGAPFHWAPCGRKICIRTFGPDGRDDTGWTTGDDIVWDCDRHEPSSPD